jgi:hypothetical protein
VIKTLVIVHLTPDLVPFALCSLPFYVFLLEAVEDDRNSDTWTIEQSLAMVTTIYLPDNTPINALPLST